MLAGRGRGPVVERIRVLTPKTGEEILAKELERQSKLAKP